MTYTSQPPVARPGVFFRPKTTRQHGFNGGPSTYQNGGGMVVIFSFFKYVSCSFSRFSLFYSSEEQKNKSLQLLELAQIPT